MGVGIGSGAAAVGIGIGIWCYCKRRNNGKVEDKKVSQELAPAPAKDEEQGADEHSRMEEERRRLVEETGGLSRDEKERRIETVRVRVGCDADTASEALEKHDWHVYKASQSLKDWKPPEEEATRGEDQEEEAACAEDEQGEERGPAQIEPRFEEEEKAPGFFGDQELRSTEASHDWNFVDIEEGGSGSLLRISTQAALILDDMQQTQIEM